MHSSGQVLTATYDIDAAFFFASTSFHGFAIEGRAQASWVVGEFIVRQGAARSRADFSGPMSNQGALCGVCCTSTKLSAVMRVVLLSSFGSVVL